MVGEACLPSNAYYPRTPDYTLCSGVHVCWSEHSDSSFVYGFMILNYGFGTMTATTLASDISMNLSILQNKLSIVHCNVQSITRKIDILSSELFESDILAFSETWLNPPISKETLHTVV